MVCGPRAVNLDGLTFKARKPDLRRQDLRRYSLKTSSAQPCATRYGRYTSSGTIDMFTATLRVFPFALHYHAASNTCRQLYACHRPITSKRGICFTTVSAPSWCASSSLLQYLIASASQPLPSLDYRHLTTALSDLLWSQLVVANREHYTCLTLNEAEGKR